jgi:alpha-tubulin suppressor-like RCC1 family protein
LTEKGHVCSWGWNFWGQLGIGKSNASNRYISKFFSPDKLIILGENNKCIKILKIFCGGEFSLLFVCKR